MKITTFASLLAALLAIDAANAELIVKVQTTNYTEFGIEVAPAGIADSHEGQGTDFTILFFPSAVDFGLPEKAKTVAGSLDSEGGLNSLVWTTGVNEGMISKSEERARSCWCKRDCCPCCIARSCPWAQRYLNLDDAMFGAGKYVIWQHGARLIAEESAQLRNDLDDDKLKELDDKIPDGMKFFVDPPWPDDEVLKQLEDAISSANPHFEKLWLDGGGTGNGSVMRNLDRFSEFGGLNR